MQVVDTDYADTDYKVSKMPLPSPKYHCLAEIVTIGMHDHSGYFANLIRTTSLCPFDALIDHL